MFLFVVALSLLPLVLGYDQAEIVFAGDAMMHIGQIDAARRPGGAYDFSEYFAGVQEYIQDADYAVVNLETPVSAAPFTGYPQFNAPGQYLDALADAGFDLFLTANNHTLDRRDEGLRNTIDSLDRRHLRHIGTYKCIDERESVMPFVRTINGIKVGFVNYTYGTNGLTPGRDVCVDYIDRDLMRRDVESAREKGAEFIFACVHWGNEYQMYAHKSQHDLAKYLHELGVQAVIGSHPHVVQPIEFEDGQLTVYSLGNFISNMRTRDTRGGALVKVVLRRNDEGKVVIDDVSHRLVFTEPADGRHNFRLRWVEESADARAKAFAKQARKVLGDEQ